MILKKYVKKVMKKIDIIFFQSNNGEIINKLHEVEKNYDGLIINPRLLLILQ